MAAIKVVYLGGGSIWTRTGWKRSAGWASG
jgi:hypothetical protein